MSHNDEVGLEEQIISQMAGIVEQMSRMLEQLLARQDEHSGSLLELKREFTENLREIRERVARLVKVLHEGNGERPLMTRVILNEREITDLKEWRESLERVEETKKKGRWQLTVAVVSGLFGLIASLVSLLN